jgi:protein-S-isoprenylcysteine O-methyltransferase Ste14
MSDQANGENQPSSDAPAVRMGPLFVRSVLSLMLFAALWFGLAGRLDWVQGWTFLLVFLGYVGALVDYLARRDPELLQERNRAAENVEPWDRVVMGSYSVLLVVLLGLAVLDAGRYRCSSVPLGAQLFGWVLLGVSGGIIWHVMGINAYLSSWARIQKDRGQVVVTQGLYGHVRHPMYLGIILDFVGLPLALGSWWAAIPAGPIVGLFVYRTAREDRMLRQKLPGYEAYAGEVHYRLLPGIW